MTDTLKTCLVSGRMALPNDRPVADATVDFALSRPDWDETIMPPAKVSAGLDAEGRFEAPLWPNGRGAQGSQYIVYLRYRAAAVSDETLVSLGRITVPDTDAADLADLLDLPPAQPIGEGILRQVLAAREGAVSAAGSAAGSASAAAGSAGAANADAGRAEAAAGAASSSADVALGAKRDAATAAGTASAASSTAAGSSTAAALSASAAAGSAGTASAAAELAARARDEIAAGVATEYGCHIYNAVSLPSGVYIATRHVRAAGVLDNYYVELISGNGLYLVTVEVNGVGKTSWEVSPGAPIKQGATSIPVNTGDNISLVVSGAPNPGEMIVKLWGVLS